MFEYLHRRQTDVFVTRTPTTHGLEFYCAIISVIEECMAPNCQLRTIESHGIGIQATSNIVNGDFICVGHVFTTTLANHTGIAANILFQRNDLPNNDKKKK
jgi:hypothetical protein